MAEHAIADDFEVAKSVVEKLEGLPTERRERVLRWVCESLGIINPAALRAPTVPPPSPSPSSPVGPGAPPPAAVDIKTFVTSKKPRSDMQFVAVVAHYYRFEAPESIRRSTVTPEVVQDAARLVGRDRLHDAKSTLANAKNQGYLDNPSRGEYAINTVGENLVAIALPGGAEMPPRGTRKAAAKKKSAKMRR